MAPTGGHRSGTGTGTGSGTANGTANGESNVNGNASSDRQVAASNSTLNAWVGGRQPSWLANGKPVKPSPRPAQPARRQPNTTESARPVVATTQPASVQVSTPATTPAPPQPLQLPRQPRRLSSTQALAPAQIQQISTSTARPVLPSPAPSDEPSPGATNPQPAPAMAESRFAIGALSDDGREPAQGLASVGPSSFGSRPDGGVLAFQASPLVASAPSLSGATSIVPSLEMEIDDPPSPASSEQLQNPADTRPTKRRRLGEPATQFLETYGAAPRLKLRLDSLSGLDSLLPQVERPRYQLVLEACEGGDLFFVVFHQIFCIWTVRKSTAHELCVNEQHGSLPPDPRDVAGLDEAFRTMEVILKSNSGLRTQHLEYLADFPIPIHQAVNQNVFRSHLRQVMGFLLCVRDRWATVHGAHREKRYPFLVGELLDNFLIFSPILQAIMFRASRRDLGIADGPHSAELEALFKEDQQFHQNAPDVFSKTPPPPKYEQHNKNIIARYENLIAKIMAQPRYQGSQQPPIFQQSAIQQQVMQQQAIQQQAMQQRAQQAIQQQAQQAIQQRAQQAMQQQAQHAVQQQAIERQPMQLQAIQQPAIQQQAIQRQAIQRQAIQQPAIQQPTIQQADVQQPAVPQLPSYHVGDPRTNLQMDSEWHQANSRAYLMSLQMNPRAGQAAANHQTQQCPSQASGFQHHAAPAQNLVPRGMSANQFMNYQNSTQNPAPHQTPHPTIQAHYHHRGAFYPGYGQRDTPVLSAPPPSTTFSQPPNSSVQANPNLRANPSLQGGPLFTQHTQYNHVPQQVAGRVPSQVPTPNPMSQYGRPPNLSILGGRNSNNGAPGPNIGQPNVQFGPQQARLVSQAQSQAQNQVQNQTQNQTQNPAHNQAQNQAQRPAYPQSTPNNPGRLIPEPGMRIHPKDYPSSPYDKRSVESSLHQSHVRSPKRIPRQLGEAGLQKHYQAIKSFALTPVKIIPNPYIYKLKFDIEDSVFGKLVRYEMKPGELLPVRFFSSGSLRVRVRCCLMRSDTPAEKEWVTAQTAWPQHICMELNGRALAVMRKAHHSKDLPAEALFVKSGINELDVVVPYGQGMTPSQIPWIAVEIVETLSHNDVLQMVHTLGSLPASTTREKIKNRLAGSSTQGIYDDELSMADYLSIDLTDPFSSSMFKIPVRGKACVHLECFDLETWLNTRPGKKSCSKCNGRGCEHCPSEPSFVDNWKCPLCDSDARPYSLVIDGFLVEVRSQLEAQNRLRTKSILAYSDGTWKANTEPVDDDDEFDSDDDTRPRTGKAPSGSAAAPIRHTSQTEIVEIDDD